MSVGPIRIQFSEEMKNEMLSKVRGILDSGKLILGKYTEKLERRVAELTNRRFGVAVSNDTAGLKIVLRYLSEVYSYPKRVVIMPATSFSSCANAALEEGYDIELVDVCLRNGIHPKASMFEAGIKKALSQGYERIVVMAVHCGGYIPFDTSDLYEVCMGYGQCTLIEDFAHSLGAMSVGGLAAGESGYASITSFYATKVFGGGEGGCLVTNDSKLVSYAKCVRNYGRENVFGDSVCAFRGDNWRLTEIQAAIVLSIMENKTKVLNRRGVLASAYHYGLHDVKGIDLVVKDTGQSNWYRYIVRLDESKFNKDFVDFLRKRGILLPGKVYDRPVHLNPVFTDKFPNQVHPVAEKYCREHLCLPLDNSMELKDVKEVVSAVRAYFNG